jgi:hypothetical protein
MGDDQLFDALLLFSLLWLCLLLWGRGSGVDTAP